ncbi:MAG: excinuclease ABC subunit UvrC [Microbacteriaceae bacterium]|nr:excinuclease ABC subunit UvrC [Microbacteriaceae bacterium]
MSTDLAYRPATSDIPTNPGVYRFFDSSGRVLYVGKAKNLRARLSSYFAPLATLHERTRRMVTSAVDVKWTVVGTEFEALQLEFTWIKEFDPPFNIQFRDDKSYPYLAITMAEDVPRVFITRRRGIPGAKYFGPYTKSWAIRETLEQILRVFPVRSCSDGVYRKAAATGRPCLLGDIGRCSAPCAGRVTPEDHRKISLQLGSFMAGRNDNYVDKLRTDMLEASERQEYERAAKIRDAIEALNSVASKSAVVLDETIDADVFGVARDELTAAVHVFRVRGGKVRGVRAWTVDTELNANDEDFCDSMLRAAYEEGEEIPSEIVVPAVVDDAEALADWLTGLRRIQLDDSRAAKVKVRVAQRGSMASLASTVTENAVHALALHRTKRSSDYVTRTAALSDLQVALGLPEAPLRIECFDVSHLGGTHVVGSMVVFEDGLPKKAHYRKFNISETTDDTDSIAQLMRRRVARLDVEDQENATGFAYPPGLLIVDGGRPQVEAASRVLRDTGHAHIPVCGLAKRLEEVWLPGDAFPVILPRNSNALFLLQRIRDEAHRFAITFQRAKRKKDIRSELSAIPGVGPHRVATLLSHFGSVSELRRATSEEISSVSGISEALARVIAEAIGSTPSVASSD